MLEIQNLSFAYPNKSDWFTDFSFLLQQGEVCSLLGESGSGKSTLLKLIYGIYNWNAGRIFFDGNEIYGPKANLVPGEEGMKWVAQDFDLMPYSTVAENVGIYYSNILLQEKREKVLNLLELVGLESFADTQVALLSGGQKQRVALAKALAEQPKLLLLDEAFNQVDAHLKNNLQRRLFRYVRENEITVLMVTHQVQDALAFADRIDVLDNGQILESQKPNDLFLQPKHHKTAELIGDINIINGTLFGLENKDYFIHPFQFQLSESGLECTVRNCYFKGSHYLIEAEYEGEKVYFENEIALDININITIEYLN